MKKIFLLVVLILFPQISFTEMPNILKKMGIAKPTEQQLEDLIKSDTEIAKCLEAVNIKKKPKLLNKLNPLYKEVAMVITVQNGCDYAIEGYTKIKFLDAQDFLIHDDLYEFSVPRLGLAKQSFVTTFFPARGYKNIRKEIVTFDTLRIIRSNKYQ